MREMDKLPNFLGSLFYFITISVYTKYGDNMKHVKMMILEHCPYCKKAFKYINELQNEYDIYCSS